ncbi:hypothetical protein ACQ23P_12905 [Staphylococcus cohnii]|uniref:hypothetical protein n=1 Tax=Staphylococcus TaxID=1279 RepID=UPI001438582A|nr:hypothetical protein [Staphylococcus arlettae]NKE86029.1 hypothetical protein [Staphylococcus arlettae]URN40492.1 hypothetical protein NAA64_12985 [Staphylococcus arlettae]
MSLGYEFKLVDNACRFSQYDIQVISEAMERYKLVGGTMKQALHYTMVKFEQGQEVADAIPQPTKEVEETVTDLTELQNNVTNEIINSMTMKFNELQTDLTETVKQINGSDNKAEDVEQLKKENEALKRKYDTLTQDYQKLHNDLSQIANMSIWEFRKWKKINEYNEYFMFRLTIKT